MTTTVDTSEIELLGELIAASMKAYGENSRRSQQAAAGIIGMSNLGFCRQKALLMLRGIPESDPGNIASAQIGTAIHEYYGTALRSMFPDWILETEQLVCRFPSGYEVPGTPDAIVPQYNAVVDFKSVDGLQKIKRYGPSQSNRYQRTGYCAAAIQKGLLDPERPIWVANYYIDRSAREGGPYFQFEQYDPAVLDEIDEWIGDVVYAAKQGEDASRDVVSIVCSQICSHFTVCRGGLEVHDGQQYLGDSEEIVQAVEMVVDSKELKKKAERMYDEGRAILEGINGVTDTHQIRWVEVNGRNGNSTMRLDIDEIPARA